MPTSEAVTTTTATAARAPSPCLPHFIAPPLIDRGECLTLRARREIDSADGEVPQAHPARAGVPVFSHLEQFGACRSERRLDLRARERVHLHLRRLLVGRLR